MAISLDKIFTTEKIPYPFHRKMVYETEGVHHYHSTRNYIDALTAFATIVPDNTEIVYKLRFQSDTKGWALSGVAVIAPVPKAIKSRGTKKNLKKELGRDKY